MPLELPNLDDRTFADLNDEARTLLPTYASGWTNHNPSDPGITLVELFAYLSEALIYRLNRTSDEMMRTFLRLLKGPDWVPTPGGRDALARDMRDTIIALRTQERAVTVADFEVLALEADSRVARVRAVPRRNYRADFDRERPGHVSLVVVPAPDHEAELGQIMANVGVYLEPRRLLGTRVHLVEPQHVDVTITATALALPDEDEAAVAARAEAAVTAFFDPISGGPEGRGWPFGRDVYVSDMFELLERVPGVDYVSEVKPVATAPGRERKDAYGRLVGLEVKPYELARLTAVDVTVPMQMVV